MTILAWLLSQIIDLYVTKAILRKKWHCKQRGDPCFICKKDVKTFQQHSIGLIFCHKRELIIVSFKNVYFVSENNDTISGKSHVREKKFPWTYFIKSLLAAFYNTIAYEVQYFCSLVFHIIVLVIFLFMLFVKCVNHLIKKKKNWKSKLFKLNNFCSWFPSTNSRLKLVCRKLL